MEAYCAQLASQSLTHVMLIQDWSFAELDKEHINMETVFNEPFVTSERAFDRFCRFRAMPNVISKQFHEFWQSVKRQHVDRDQPVFLFPDHFDEPTFNDQKFSRKGEWMFKEDFTEQIVFDLRTDQQKSLQEQLKSRNAFKKNFDIWEDKPHIISS